MGRVDAKAGDLASMPFAEGQGDADKSFGSGVEAAADRDGHRNKRLKVGDTYPSSIKAFEDLRFIHKLGNNPPFLEILMTFLGKNYSLVCSSFHQQIVGLVPSRFPPGCQRAHSLYTWQSQEE